MQPALLCMQFADSAGNIAAGALTQTNTLYYGIFWIFLLFSERFWEVEDCFMLQPHANTYVTLFERVTCPLWSSSKRYQIPFRSLQKGIRYRMQNPKNPRKYKSIACGSRITSCSLQKGRWLPLELLQKVIKYPLEQIACGIRELHATPILIAIYRWEILIESLQNGGRF